MLYARRARELGMVPVESGITVNEWYRDYFAAVIVDMRCDSLAWKVFIDAHLIWRIRKDALLKEAVAVFDRPPGKVIDHAGLRGEPSVAAGLFRASDSVGIGFVVWKISSTVILRPSLPVVRPVHLVDLADKVEFFVAADEVGDEVEAGDDVPCALSDGVVVNRGGVPKLCGRGLFELAHLVFEFRK